MGKNTYFILRSHNEEQKNALIALAKAMNMDFSVSRNKPYNPDFVAKIKKSQKDFEEGKGKTLTLQQLNELWK